MLLIVCCHADNTCSGSPWDAKAVTIVVTNALLSSPLNQSGMQIFKHTLNCYNTPFTFWNRYSRMCFKIFWWSNTSRLLTSPVQVALLVFSNCHLDRTLCILSLHNSLPCISEITFIWMRSQASTEAKELPSRSIIRLMWSKSRSWHCNLVNLLHDSSLNKGGRSSSSTMTD